MSFEAYVEAVKIDDCHVSLIFSLVKSHKPNSVLELGFGSGNSAKAILSACGYNQKKCKYTLVDNWMDFGRKIPDEFQEYLDENWTIDVVTSEEKDYIDSCSETFDFILSDADHSSCHRWFDRVYNDILNPGGILIYHDVTSPEYKNLYGIVVVCALKGLSHVVFSKSSRPDERCERGLLVIFKPR